MIRISLKSTPLVASLVTSILLALGCAPGMPIARLGSSTGYDLLEDGTRTDADFEVAPRDIDPAEVVPLDLLQGPHHVVRSVRLDHGFLYTYVIESDRGELEVVGRGMLRKRVIEAAILGESQQSWLGGTRLYAFEVANSASDPIEGALQILRHPIRTVTNVPKGMVASYKALLEMKERGRTFHEDDYYYEFIGLSAEKREWADRMGFDPYTTNPHVKSWLSRNGWLSLAGYVTVTLATIPVPAGGGTIAMSIVGATSGMNEQLADVAPEDIRVTTRSFLGEELGVEGELAKRFLEHPWYSPSRQRTIIRALARMEGAAHRDRFIEMAARADEPHEAFGFTRLALMFAECHVRRGPIEEIFVSNDILMARTRAQEVVLPLYMDFAYWTAEVEAAEQEIVRSLTADGDAPERLLILSGHMSPRASRELGERGWEVVDGLEELWLSEFDVARYQPAERNAERILPEFGY